MGVRGILIGNLFASFFEENKIISFFHKYPFILLSGSIGTLSGSHRESVKLKSFNSLGSLLFDYLILVISVRYWLILSGKLDLGHPSSFKQVLSDWQRGTIETQAGRSFLEYITYEAEDGSAHIGRRLGNIRSNSKFCYICLLPH